MAQHTLAFNPPSISHSRYRIPQRMSGTASFFHGATNVQVFGGEFNEVHGDYIEINGSSHTSNINSFNTTNNTAINSFNTNSEYYYHGQQGRHQITPNPEITRSGFGGRITTNASNSSDNASQTYSNGDGLGLNMHRIPSSSLPDFMNIMRRAFPSENFDDDSGGDISDSEGHETPLQFPTANMMPHAQQWPVQVPNPQSNYVPHHVSGVPFAQQSVIPGAVIETPPSYDHAASSQSTHGTQEVHNIFGGAAVFGQGTSGATFTTVNGSLTKYDYSHNITNINSGNVLNNHYEDSYNTTTEIHTTRRQRKLGKNIRRGA